MNVEIADRLARRRREAGYSQEGLAEKLGVSRQAVSKWERSESSPDTDNLIALAQLYGVSLDELLYVDEGLEDDVAFEAADKAAQRKAQTAGARPADAPPSAAGVAEDPAWPGDAEGSEGQAPSPDPGKAPKVNIGRGGIHVEDGGDYVHMSWKDGINVKEADDGDEVHVGWDGIHVKEGKKKHKRHGHGDTWFTGDDGEETVVWNDEGVYVNGEHYDSWHDAHDAFKKRHGFGKVWLKFPFPLVVIIAYILIGAFLNAWAVGLFVFFLIPVYYMVGNTIYSKRLIRFFAGFYPLACVAWFLWMAFAVGQPHPAWVIFLTIPVAEWVFHAIHRAHKRRKKEAQVVEVTDVTDKADGSEA